MTGSPDEKPTNDQDDKNTKPRPEDFAPYSEPRGTLGLGLPNEGLADRIERQWEEEQRKR